MLYGQDKHFKGTSKWKHLRPFSSALNQDPNPQEYANLSGKISTKNGKQKYFALKPQI